MNVEKKIFDSKAAVEDGDKGIVHLIASVFGNVDSDGDIMVKGAFARTIDVGKGKGKLPPGVWGHDWTLPVAKTVDAYEDENGLNVLAQFNLGTQRGRESFSDIKEGLITEYSFGFKVLDSEKKDGSRLIKDVEWFEWSPVLVGANRETSTVSVKQSSGKQTDEESEEPFQVPDHWSLEYHSEALTTLSEAFKVRIADVREMRTKQGRVLSTTNRSRLQGHREALMSVCDDLGALMDETDPEPKASSQEIHQALVQYQAITAQGLGVNV